MIDSFFWMWYHFRRGGMDMKNICCPECGSCHVDVQVFQEHLGSKTTERTNSRYEETKKKHGILWWVFIGWWWITIKGLFWIVAFIPMALLKIGRRKTYKGQSAGKTTVKNDIRYKKIYVCKECGHDWAE